MIGGHIDDGINGRNGGFPAFERKSFLPYVFGMQEFFKHHAFVQFFQDALFFLQRQGLEKFLLHLIGEPVYFFLVADVLEFDAYMIGIALLKLGKNITECGGS